MLAVPLAPPDSEADPFSQTDEYGMAEEQAQQRMTAEAKAVEERTRELDAAAAGIQTIGLLVAAPRRSWLARLFGRLFAPAPLSETEIAVRLLCAWTIGKPEASDEVTQGLAVLTARQLVTLTGGR